MGAHAWNCLKLAG